MINPVAYRVPFHVDRSDAPAVHRLINIGDERVTHLRVCLLGPGVMLPISRLHLEPSQAVTVLVRGHDLARSSVLIIRWFRPGGEEYLWRVAF